MEKINFENLPSENTPINQDNLNLMQSNIEKSVVAIGNTVPSTNEKFWAQNGGKNLLNEMNIITGLYSVGTGIYSNSTGNRCTKNMIQIDNTKNYVLSTGSNDNASYMYVMYYNSDKTYLGYTASTLKTPIILNSYNNYSNAKYINLRFDTTNLPQPMLEQGNAKTTYEEYIPKRILVKNSNNIFEEFYDENDNVIAVGENSNGNYIKYANGICIQYGKKDMTTGSTSYTSGGFTHYVAQEIYDLPIPFKDYYEIFANVSSANVVLVNLIYAETNTDRSKFNLNFISSSANYTRTIHWLAIGRW